MRNAFPIIASLLAASASAAPTEGLAARDSITITQEQILQFAPKASCCSSATNKDECITAKAAVDPINKAIANYKVTSAAEIAAVLSLEAFESGSFEFNHNHFPAPGKPGQGTRNMQSPKYNLMYAQSISALKSQLDPIVNVVNDADKLSDNQKDKVLALLNANQEYSFGSGFWFLTTQCTSQRAALQKGDDAGWTSYIRDCVGTDPAEDGRKDLWTKAKAALKVS